jgi:hypothetical protein
MRDVSQDTEGKFFYETKVRIYTVDGAYFTYEDRN